MEQGVRLADPARFDVRGTLECGQDVEIDVNCVFEGAVSLGDGVRIGANCVIANARIEAGAVIHPFTHIDGEKAGVTVGEGALIGPFARLRPGARAGRRGAHRQLRRGQELHAGARRQGQPPGLPGRCHGGRARELRRRQHHRQLRRRQQAPHRDRGRRARGQQLRAGGAGDASARGGTVGGGSTITKDTEPGRADDRARPAGQHRELAAAGEGAKK